MTYQFAPFPHHVAGRLDELAAQACNSSLLHKTQEHLAGRLPQLLLVSTGLWAMHKPYDETGNSTLEALWKTTKQQDPKHSASNLESTPVWSPNSRKEWVAGVVGSSRETLVHFQTALAAIRQSLQQVRRVMRVMRLRACTNPNLSPNPNPNPNLSLSPNPNPGVCAEGPLHAGL